MKRFDVCPASSFEGKGKNRLVVILQHDVLDSLTTTVVAPLYRPGEYRVVVGLTPIVNVGRQRLVVAVDRLGAIRKQQLGKTVGNLEPHHYDLLRAIDLLFTGF